MSSTRRLALLLATLSLFAGGCTLDLGVTYPSYPVTPAASSSGPGDAGAGDGGGSGDSSHLVFVPTSSDAGDGGAGHLVGASSPYAFPVGPAGGGLSGTYPNPTVSAGSLALSGDVTGAANANTLSGSVSTGTLTWGKALSPVLTQATPTSDVATAALTLTSQAPYASAVTNLSPGNLNLNIPNILAGGTHGKVQVEEGGTVQLALGNDGTYGQSLIAPSSTLEMVAVGAGNYVDIKSVSNAVYLDGSSINLRPSAGGTADLSVTSTTLTLNAPTISWLSGAGTPAIQQSNPGSDLAVTAMTIVAQGAFPGATTNLVGADLVLKGGSGATTNGAPGAVSATFAAPTGTGVESGFKVKRGATLYAQLGGLVGQGASYAALYVGNNITPNGANAAIYSSDGATIHFNGSTGVDLAVGTTDEVLLTASSLTLTPPTLTWGSTVAAPTISQVAQSSTSAGSGAAGQTLAITAEAGQAATGAGNNGGAGGALTLSSGAGGTSGSATKGAPGAINLSTNGVSGTDASAINFQNGSTSYLALSENAGATTSQLLLPSGITNLVLNASNGSQTIQFQAPSNTIAMSSAGTTFTAPVGGQGGAGGSAFKWLATTVALTSGASNVLTNVQYNYPHIKFTGTLTGAGTTITFPATDGACWDLDFSAVVTIADSIALIANGNTWGTAVASVATEFPHVCYSSGVGRLVGTAMTQ